MKRLLMLLMILLGFGPIAFGAIYNVSTYGATGNGSTNDTTAIQSAINAANSAGSGTVYFPVPSVCYMITGLTLYNNITYDGGLPSACVKQISGSAASMFVGGTTTTAATGITISNLSMDGNMPGYASNRSCIYLYGPTTVNILSVSVQKCQEDGLYVTGYGASLATSGNGLYVNNFNSTNNGRNGMTVIAGSNISVRNSSFTWNNTSGPYDGVDLEPNDSSQDISNVTFENCDFSNNGRTANTQSGHTGFNVWSPSNDLPNLNLLLVNNTYNGNGRDGIYISPGGTHRITGVTIIRGSMSGNLAQNAYRGGIDIWYSNDVSINGISIASTAATGSAVACWLQGITTAKVLNSSLNGASYDFYVGGTNSGITLYNSTTLVNGTHTGTYSTAAGIAPTLTLASFASGYSGTAYTQTVTATGDATVTFDLASNVYPTSLAGFNWLPAGVTMTTAGVASGTPTTVGTYVFSVTATNSLGYDYKTYTVVINNTTGGLARKRVWVSE